MTDTPTPLLPCEPTRYSFIPGYGESGYNDGGEMKESADGEYVTYADFATLKADLARMRNALELANIVLTHLDDGSYPDTLAKIRAALTPPPKEQQT